MTAAPTRNPEQNEQDVELVTFGCRMNIFESEVMKDYARSGNVHPDPASGGKTFIINTCAVTKEAERQARQTIRRLKRENPQAQIVVTGCSAQLTPETYGNMPEVARVMGNAEKMRAESWQFGMDEGAESAPVHVTDIMTVRETAEHLLSGFEDKSRAFVQVQQGCDHRCTFCIIPFARGPNRSVPMGRVVEQVRQLVQGGTQEIVLTGVDITAWGEDMADNKGSSPRLGQLVRRLLNNVPELERLRLTSLDPVEVDAELLDLICSEPRLLPHVHISVQAGDDMILKRMKRRHLRHDVISLCDTIKARRPEVVFGADIIAGFPTETEEMFQQSLDLIERCDITHVHIFPFSPRPGTPAAKMPQIDGAVVKDRAARLRQAGARRMAALQQRQQGKEVAVLVEDPTPDGSSRGHASNYLPVVLTANPARRNLAPGSVVMARIIASDGKTLQAEVLA